MIVYASINRQDMQRRWQTCGRSLQKKQVVMWKMAARVCGCLRQVEIWRVSSAVSVVCHTLGIPNRRSSLRDFYFQWLSAWSGPHCCMGPADLKIPIYFTREAHFWRYMEVVSSNHRFVLLWLKWWMLWCRRHQHHQPWACGWQPWKLAISFWTR